MEPPSMFISYSKVDAAFALQLASRLRSEGIGIWIDQLDIAPGARWDRAIEAAMTAADRLLVVLSPTSTASENVQDEIGLALDTGKRIIPVLCKPCEVPMRLRRLQHIDFTQDHDRAFERLLAAARLPAATAAGQSAGAPAPSASAASRPGAAATAASVPHAPAGTSSASKAQGTVFSLRNIGIGAVLLAVLVGTIARLSGLVAGPEAQCDQVGTLRSVDGDAQTLEIKNNLANPVTLYWVDHAGKLQNRGEIPPNRRLRQDTFAGHSWVIKDIQDQCLKVVNAPAKVALP